MKLPKITTKQQDIIQLLYRCRYLNRIQIQELMGHKDKRRIISWLKDLRDKEYVVWIYSTDFSEKSKPAIYYIGINGVRYLKTVQWDNNGTLEPYYPIEEARKRYKDSERSRTFIDRSMLVAGCCMKLEEANADKNNLRYDYMTEADYIDPDSYYHFLAEHETLRPNLYVIKHKAKLIVARYLLEIFDPYLPQYRLNYRLKAYVKLLTDYEWPGNDPVPIILLVLPNIYNLIYAKRKVRRLLLNEYYEPEDIPGDLHIRFTTMDQLKQHGITAKIWEENRKAYQV